VVLVFNTAMSVFYMATCLMNLVLMEPTLGSGISDDIQCFNAGFALASLPFIVAGLSGVTNGIETHLRLYWIWLTLSFLLDAACTVALMVVNLSACKGAGAAGAAFSCGVSRVGSLILVLVTVSISGYAVFAVWSYCEELKAGGSVDSFDKLPPPEQLPKMKHAGLFGCNYPSRGEPFPSVYGSLACSPVGGSVTIFGGTYHNVNYPPNKATQI